MVIVDVGEAILLEIAQDHAGVIADANISSRIDCEVRIFSSQRAPAKMNLFVLSYIDDARLNRD
jgi:hypothetical protein